MRSTCRRLELPDVMNAAFRGVSGTRRRSRNSAPRRHCADRGVRLAKWQEKLALGIA